MHNVVLVIGGGLAGVRASVELLQQRFRIYLLEEGPSVSAKLVIMGKLFPPNEDASCALQPLMLELTSNPNATILTSSKLLSLQGRPGDFRIKVLKKQADIKAGSRSIDFTVGAVIVSERLEIERNESLGKLGLELVESDLQKEQSLSCEIDLGEAIRDLDKRTDY